MDLMQAFTQKHLKAEPPVVEVGDTVRVHIKVKEGNRERIQVFEGTASVWRRCSPSTLPPLRRSRPSATVRSAAPSCTTCATAWASPPRSRKPCNPT